MKRLRVALLVFLAAAGAVLVLNLREKDYYEYGSLVPPKDASVPDDDPLYRRLLPPQVSHACRVCGECTHPLETVQSRRRLAVVDRDGWYRLFWAGSERYYYEDPPALAAAMMNSTAGPVEGRWSIRARVGRATHGPSEPHDCGEVPAEVALEYDFFSTKDEIPDRPLAAGPLRVLESALFLSYRYDRPHLPPELHFGWRLAAPPSVTPARCPCSKP